MLLAIRSGTSVLLSRRLCLTPVGDGVPYRSKSWAESGKGGDFSRPLPYPIGYGRAFSRVENSQNMQVFREILAAN